MALIDIDDFREVVGIVGATTLYPDAMIQPILDSAEDVIRPLLKFNRAGIIKRELSNNVATLRTLNAHKFNTGDSVVITNCGTTFNGTKTITSVTTYGFSFAKTASDVPVQNVFPPGDAVVGAYTAYDTVEAVRQAALMIAVDIWSSRQSASGQAQGVDFVPGPYRMGKSMISRVQGLISSYRDVNSMVG